MNHLIVHLPPRVWLSANRPILNHGHRRRVIQDIHETTFGAATAQKLARSETEVVATWTVRYPKGTSFRADPANSSPTTKAILDALVPRWLPRDDATFVVEERFRRGQNTDRKGWHTIVLTLIPALIAGRDLTLPAAYPRGTNETGPAGNRALTNASHTRRNAMAERQSCTSPTPTHSTQAGDA